MSTRKFSNSSIKTGERATSLTGEPPVAGDAADAYHSNLKIWIRGGYNGATAGNISSGTGTIDVPIYGSGTSTINTNATVQRVDSNASGSPVNSSANRFIKDGKAGNSAQLRNDKLAFYFNGSSNPIIWKALDTTTWNTSTTNRTFAYWMKWDDVSTNTSASIITPVFHSWSGSNANCVDLVAHDWYTNGTGNPRMDLYSSGAARGSYTLSNLAGGTNGNKNVWFHFAIVHTSSTTEVYVNGMPVDHSYTVTSSWLTPGSDQAFSWNSRADGQIGGLPRNYATGSSGVKSLADIRYYDTNLSAAAINAIYGKSKVYYN